MKKSVMVLGLIIIGMFFAAVNANAEVVSFSDTNKYWPGWNNSSSDDSKDVIGIPNFTGGQATITGGQLNNITFNRAAGTNPLWWALSPGDLFIDIDANHTWDYVVDLSGWSSSGPRVSDAGPGTYGIYSLNLALNSQNGYTLSGLDNTGNWSGLYIRDSHPVAVNLDEEYAGFANFSGWGDDSVTEYSFDFKGLNLGSSGQFTIGWQPNCANDVVYETLRYSTTPEPATVSLLGLGIAGLLRFRKRKI